MRRRKVERFAMGLNVPIRGIFAKAYNGQSNLMTPEVVQLGKQGKFYYELSRGTGFSGNNIFGVTVLNVEGEERRPDLNKLFSNLSMAEQYIKSLRSK